MYNEGIQPTAHYTEKLPETLFVTSFKLMVASKVKERGPPTYLHIIDQLLSKGVLSKQIQLLSNILLQVALNG